MAIGHKDETSAVDSSPTSGRTGSYAGNLMTSRGPVGNTVRKKLKIGDKLADGTTYTGDMRTRTLEKQLAATQEKIASLQEFEAEILAELDKGQKRAAPAAKKAEEPAPLEVVDAPKEEEAPETKPPTPAKRRRTKKSS